MGNFGEQNYHLEG